MWAGLVGFGQMKAPMVYSSNWIVSAWGYNNGMSYPCLVQVQCILAHCPAESEWERVLQHLVRLDPLTQLHSLSNIYSCLFIKSIHGNCWKFPSFSRSLLHLLPETQETRGALLTLGLHQQLLESDQLSAMYTLSKGGGWRGDWLRSGRWQFTGRATTTWTSLRN